LTFFGRPRITCVLPTSLAATAGLAVAAGDPCTTRVVGSASK
jgi:hypothetical protein